MQIDRLSATRVSMYTRCPAAYYFRYPLNIVGPPPAVVVRGASFHKAIEHNYRQKVDTAIDEPLSVVLDTFSDDFNERIREARLRDGEERGKIKDTGVAMLRCYQSEIAEAVQPVEVEREFELEIGNKSWNFTGRLDLVDKSGCIIETKTTGKRLKKPKVDHILQVSGYWTFSESEHQIEHGARIDDAVGTKKPVTLSFPVEIDAGKISFFLNLIAQVAHGIENEVFFPNRGNMLCSENWCYYWDRCHSEFGG